MLSADENENKPIGKPGPRKEKAESGKGEQRSRKAAQQKAPKPDRSQSAQEKRSEKVSEEIRERATEATAPVAPALSSAVETSAAEPSPAETSPTGPVESAESAPVSLQTIANAYGDYSKRSFEQTRSFFERLAGVRSLDKALEVQTEFAKEAYAAFVEQSRRLHQLHSELARQRLSRLEGFVAKMTKPR